MITIVDYGVGNLFSLISSFRSIGCEVEVTGDPEKIKSASKILLPGVGAFQDARKKLSENGLDTLLIEKASSGTPFMGVCLGMQLLFDKSFEYGEHSGLGLIPGEVRSMTEYVPSSLKIPHMGWNALHFTGEKPELFKYTEEGDHVYFVHSFSAVGCEESIAATCEYGVPITAAVASGNIYGCQFHPEKSGRTGLNILKAFQEIGEKTC